MTRTWWVAPAAPPSVIGYTTRLVARSSKIVLASISAWSALLADPTIMGVLYPVLTDGSSEDPASRTVLPRISRPTAEPTAMRIPATGALSMILFSMLTLVAVWLLAD